MSLKKLLLGASFLGLSAVAQADVVVITGDFTTDTTLVSSVTYVLQGPTQGVIRVLPGVTLAIPAGTIIRGQPQGAVGAFNGGSLVALRGAKIIAVGSAGDPIVFTTAAVETGTPDGMPDGYSRTGVPQSASPSVIATRFDPTLGAHWETGIAPLAGATPPGITGVLYDNPEDGTNDPLWWDAVPKVTPMTNLTSGLWGGVILLGRAPVNDAVSGGAGEVLLGVETSNMSTAANNPYDYTLPVIEGLTSPDYRYGADWGAIGASIPSDPVPVGTPVAFESRGGVIADDDSGNLQFISIRHGGQALAEGNEINGLTLGGVGRGTKISHIEVWGNEDDGIEIFGGTVNLSNILIVGVKDDGLDIDHGYMGNIQFVCVVGGGFCDRLLEWDGDDATEGGAMAGYLPRASFEVRNVTLVTAPNVLNERNQGTNIRNNSSSRLYSTLALNGATTAVFSGLSTGGYTQIRNLSINAYGSGVTTMPVSSGNIIVATTSTANFSLGAAWISDALDADEDAISGTADLVSPNGLDVRAAGGGAVLSLPSSSGTAYGNNGFFISSSSRGAFPSAGALWHTGWSAASKVPFGRVTVPVLP